ncbi:EamA family transporter [Brevibacillus dissolubilis]|uniref:EamA family transporter n=1 Tax=Brevibacillus dissolubilis TaxID=1844116 RepID=UPI0011177AE0|nr:EamA family transporter [Brevibacillus dissolubilis]
MRYMIFVFLGACSYGVLSTFVKFAYEDGYIVNEVTGSQMFYGMITAWILVLLFSRQRASLRQWLVMLGVGVSLGSTGVLYYASLQFVPASIGIVLMFQFTWIGVLIDAGRKRQWPSKDKQLALLLLLAGTVMAGGVLDGGGAWEFSLVGVLLGLASAFTYALFILFNETAAVELNPWIRGAIISTGSMLVSSVVFPPEFIFNGKLLEGTLTQWGILLAIFGIVVPTLFFAIGVPRIGGDLATILGAAELPTAVLLSSLVLHEQVTPLQWIGVVVILVGIVIPQVADRFRRTTTPATQPSQSVKTTDLT